MVNGENCLLYYDHDIDQAVSCVERICTDKQLENNLYKNGLQVAQSRDWENIKKEILNLYEES